MASLKVGTGAWVVVCDGRKALILENIGNAEYPDLRTRDAEVQDLRPTHELGTDAPGRSFSSVGHGRSAVEQTDLHQEAENTFLVALAAHLDRAVLDKSAKGLVIVAPPRALGVLRKAYSKHVRDALIGEVDKDLAALPVDQIAKRLFGDKAI